MSTVSSKVVVSPPEPVDLEAQYHDKEAYLSTPEVERADKTEAIMALPVVEKTSGASSTATLSFWIIVNTLATIAIVFTNKAIFDNPSFRNMQTSFASFHFACTTLTLYVASRRAVGMFTPRRAGFIDMLPLSVAMCFNVILPNLSLAYSTVMFYQVARILLTPLVASINYIFYHISIPGKASFALLPVCIGVGIVTYFDTMPVDSAKPTQTTTPAGVFFALSGILASSIYTIWIGTYHKKLNMSSMQLLFNQAPWSSVMLWAVAPFADTMPQWETVPTQMWVMICMSGVFASLINLSQFFIIANAGPTSSTIVGHAKTCSIVMLGWFMSKKTMSDRSILGIVMALGGIIYYTNVMSRAGKKV